MNGKIIALILVVVAAVAGGSLFVGKARSGPGVTVILRIAVSPSEQSGFVAGQANSARFKYMVGKKSGVKPVFAQKLAIKAVPNSSLVEARLDVTTQDEARRYVEAFLETLQAECAGQAQVTLAQQSIR